MYTVNYQSSQLPFFNMVLGMFESRTQHFSVPYDPAQYTYNVEQTLRKLNCILNCTYFKLYIQLHTAQKLHLEFINFPALDDKVFILYLFFCFVSIFILFCLFDDEETIICKYILTYNTLLSIVKLPNMSYNISIIRSLVCMCSY